MRRKTTKRRDGLGGHTRPDKVKRTKSWLVYNVDSYNGAVYQIFDGVEVAGPVVNPRSLPSADLHKLADSLGVWRVVNLHRAGVVETYEGWGEEAAVAGWFLHWWSPSPDEVAAYHPPAGGLALDELLNAPASFQEKGGFLRHHAVRS